jgi:hypothetical protein
MYQKPCYDFLSGKDGGLSTVDWGYEKKMYRKPCYDYFKREGWRTRPTSPFLVAATKLYQKMYRKPFYDYFTQEGWRPVDRHQLVAAIKIINIEVA